MPSPVVKAIISEQSALVCKEMNTEILILSLQPVELSHLFVRQNEQRDRDTLFAFIISPARDLFHVERAGGNIVILHFESRSTPSSFSEQSDSEVKFRYLGTTIQRQLPQVCCISQMAFSLDRSVIAPLDRGSASHVRKFSTTAAYKMQAMHTVTS